MKWVVVALVFCLATFCRGGALKCKLGSKDEACVSKNKEKVTESTKLEDVQRNRLAECLPGSEWDSNCHRCLCSDAGVALCSKLETCDKSYGEPIRCKPKSSFQRDCNTCTCLENGLALCTEKGCLSSPWLMEPVLKEKSDEVGPVLHHNLVKRSVCVPGSKYKIECNTCLCSSDGRSFTCTLLACFVGDINLSDIELFKEDKERISKEQSDESVLNACKPRGIFNIGCNTCLCDDDGSNYICTNKPCPLPDDVEVFHELTALRSPAKSVVCAANRMFIKDCNTCWCNEDGTSYFCTRKVCVEDLPEESPELPIKIHEVNGSCRPDEVFELECNMCRCNADGLSFSCTRRVCPVEEDFPLKRKTRSTSQQISRTAEAPHFEPLIKGTLKNCQPGQEFRMDCNKCLCDNEGQNFSCTRIDCAALNSNGNGGTRARREVSSYIQTDCSPGSVFSRECNTCRCTTDGGHATCTMNQCHNDADNNLPESDPNFRCNPGEQFKRNCNDCTCSADGRSVFCTLRLCDI